MTLVEAPMKTPIDSTEPLPITTPSTTIIDRETGETMRGEVPPYSVVVSGSMPGKPLKNGQPGPNLYCAVIVKRVDEKTRSKTSINELLRD